MTERKEEAAPAMPFSRPRREFRVRIVGEGERPVANAFVTLYGSGFPTHAVTDSGGQASLQSYAADGADIAGVYVRPAADYWERYVQGPTLDAGQVNVIRLSPLSRSSRGFAGQRPYGWGQRMMKFDRVATEYNGAGIKIGLIDSGCDSSHPALRHIVCGLDLTRHRDVGSWTSRGELDI
jgi:subtilisin